MIYYKILDSRVPGNDVGGHGCGDDEERERTRTCVSSFLLLYRVDSPPLLGYT
jgi:hypothetical protein